MHHTNTSTNIMLVHYYTSTKSKTNLLPPILIVGFKRVYIKQKPHFNTKPGIDKQSGFHQNPLWSGKGHMFTVYPLRDIKSKTLLH